MEEHGSYKDEEGGVLLLSPCSLSARSCLLHTAQLGLHSHQGIRRREDFADDHR